jgi:hypothetical protein
MMPYYRWQLRTIADEARLPLLRCMSPVLADFVEKVCSCDS